MMEVRFCALCTIEASVFCSSDDAFLCRSCDAKVHGANFLVARHIRHHVYYDYKSLSENGIIRISYTPFGAAAAAHDLDSVSTEVISVNWCRKLGLGADVAVRMGCSGLRTCLQLQRRTAWPFQVCLAASLWLGLRLRGENNGQILKRLEEISGVPAKLILFAAETKLERALRAARQQQYQRRRLEPEEGWDEC